MIHSDRTKLETSAETGREDLAVLDCVSRMQTLLITDLATAEFFNRVLGEMLLCFDAQCGYLFKFACRDQRLDLQLLASTEYARDAESETAEPALSELRASLARYFSTSTAPIISGDPEFASPELDRQLGFLNYFCVPLWVKGELKGLVLLGQYPLPLSLDDIHHSRAVFATCAYTLFAHEMDLLNRHSVRKTEAVLNNAPHGMVSMDHKGAVLSFNSAAEKIFDVSEWEVLGNSIETLLPGATRLFSENADERTSPTEILCLRQDGSQFPAAVGFNEFMVQDERFYVGSIQDLSQQKENETKLNQAKEQAILAHESLSRFVQSMGHELRTPLNAIMGFSTTLSEDTAQVTNARQKKQFEKILHSSQHLLNLINDIFDFSLIENGQIMLSPKTVVADDLLADCLAMVEDRAQLAGVSTRVGKVTGHHINVDPARFRQILLNLLTNAVKYNVPGGRIDVGTELLDDDYLKIYVADSGQGISPIHQQRLFTAFDRLGAEQGDIEGTGIGLALSEKLARAMGGEIRHVSEVGKGSTFWLEFPVETVTSRVAMGHELAEAQTGTIRVLYIEDNQVNIMVMEAIIEQRPGVDLTCVVDGAAGIEQARDGNYDLILTDIHLPDLSGFDVLEGLKRVVPDTPVIAVTASAMAQDVEKGLQAGFAAYVTKPIDIAEFWDTVISVLEHPVDEV